MIKEIVKDITTVTEGIVCHQVNCLGTMGSGVAAAIRQKWPEVFTTYHKKYVENVDSPWKQLGECQMVGVGNDMFADIYVANLFGQYDFGANSRYTEYCALSTALQNLNGIIEYREEHRYENEVFDLYIPYKMGCDRGGGDWNIVSQMIEELLHTNNRTIYICSLP